MEEWLAQRRRDAEKSKTMKREERESKAEVLRKRGIRRACLGVIVLYLVGLVLMLAIPLLLGGCSRAVPPAVARWVQVGGDRYCADQQRKAEQGIIDQATAETFIDEARAVQGLVIEAGK